jgi:hypothetical protein
VLNVEQVLGLGVIMSAAVGNLALLLVAMSGPRFRRWGLG